MPETSHSPRTIERFEFYTESRFWKRLEQCEKTGPWGKQQVSQLKANVGAVVEQAIWIGTQVCRYLPQYTLHDGRHYLNVLGIMDGLTPQSVMDELAPLECALCILAAYTHDLGMALSDEKYHAITDENSTSPERQEFLTHRDRFGAELRQIEHLKTSDSADAKQRSELLEGHTRDLDLNLNLALALALARDRNRAHDFARKFTSFKSLIRSHFFIESFFSDLSKSFPPLELFTFSGFVGNAMLSGPGLIELETELDDCTIRPVDLKGRLPAELAFYGYDLTSPMTAIPLGNLRCCCPKWREDRDFRRLGVFPFLFPGNESIWKENAAFFQKTLGVERIFLLIPKIELWDTPFSAWTPDDWKNCGLSALWDIPTGRVLWAQGAQKVQEMAQIGLPIDEFVKTLPENG